MSFGVQMTRQELRWVLALFSLEFVDEARASITGGQLLRSDILRQRVVASAQREAACSEVIEPSPEPKGTSVTVKTMTR